MLYGIVASQGRLSAAPPSGDPYFENVTLLMHFDGTEGGTSFIDSSPSPLTILASGAAKLTTSDPKFGSAAGLFDRTLACYAYATSTSKPSLGNGDFTIEGWVKLTQVGQFQNILRFGSGTSSGGWTVRINTSNQLQFLAHGVLTATLGTNVAFSSGVWTHFAVSRSSGALRGFIGGVLLNSPNTNTTDLTRTDQLWIAGDLLLGGLLDEVRITKGVARYTESFTPPTAPFPNS